MCPAWDERGEDPHVRGSSPRSTITYSTSQTEDQWPPSKETSGTGKAAICRATLTVTTFDLP